MTKRTTTYRGYAIDGSLNERGWCVEVHPRTPDCPILSQGTFKVASHSWNSVLADAYSRVDQVLDNQGESDPDLPAPLKKVFEAAWEIVSKDRGNKCGSHVQ